MLNWALPMWKHYVATCELRHSRKEVMPHDLETGLILGQRVGSVVTDSSTILKREEVLTIARSTEQVFEDHKDAILYGDFPKRGCA